MRIAMIKFIPSRDMTEKESAKPAGTFRLGETVFLVASSETRPQNRQLLSLTSLVIPIPVDEAAADDAPPEDDFGDSSDDTIAPFTPDDRPENSQPTGLELRAGNSAHSIEKRLASIVPDHPPALSTLSAERIRVDDGRDRRQSGFRWVASAIILLLLAGSIALSVHYHRQTQRDLQKLRTSLQDQQATASNLVIEEVRREIRQIPLTIPDRGLEYAEANAQAIRELQQTIANQAQQTQGQAQALSEFIRRELAALEREQPDLAAANEPILDELREVRETLAELRSASPSAPPPAAPVAVAAADFASADVGPAEVEAESIKPSQPEQIAAASLPPTAPVPAAAAPEATLARATLDISAQPTGRPASIYLINATGNLQHLIPEAIAEVRRLIQQEDRDAGESSYVLILSPERLIQIDGSVDAAAAVADTGSPSVTDLGPADLATAAAIALKSRPRTLHLISDTLEGGDRFCEVLETANLGGCRIDTTQLHYRGGQDLMKRIAREHDGMYSFVPAAR
jgi:hypothetical protein